MRKKVTFVLEDVDSFEKLTDAYFIGMGFRKLSNSQASLTYRNGSVLMNMVTFNPLNWKSKVVVTLKEKTVEADFDIDPVGQLVTPKEE